MPSQITPPIQYQDGDAINGDAFNQHVSHATLLSGSISEQTDISISAVPSVNKLDSIVIYDESEATTNKLRKATIEQIFSNGSSLPTSELITPKITAPAWNDIVVTPKYGVLHIGRPFYSVDGFTSFVTSTDHGLESGMYLEFTAATNVQYNGTFQITKVSSSVFTYHNKRTVAATAVSAGSINFEKSATVAVIGNVTINDDLLVAGNTAISGTAKIDGAVEVGSLKIGGKTPSTVEDNFIGINHKIATIVVGQAWGSQEYVTQTFVVPPGETWTFIWNTMTMQHGQLGNTRPEPIYQWQIKNGSSGSVLDTVQVYMGSYGGPCYCHRSIKVTNSGAVGSTAVDVSSPTVGINIGSAISLSWHAQPIPGRGKWDTNGYINITLFRQKTASLNYGYPTAIL